MYVGGDAKQAIEFAWANTSYVHCISTCNEIKGSYDKITFTIEPRYTGNNCNASSLIPIHSRESDV